MRRSRVLWLLLLALALLGSVTASARADGSGPCGEHGVLASVGLTFSCTYVGTGEDDFNVPSGVPNVDVVAVGAPGGNGASSFDDGDGTTPGGTGGTGAVVTARLGLHGRTTLYVEVGGAGTDGVSESQGVTSTCPAGAGGNNGGGMGGPGGCGSGGGGGGGGASDVRRSPASAGGLTGGARDRRLVVAGGGGGGGGGDPGYSGGDEDVIGPGGAGGSGGGSGAGAGSGGTIYCSNLGGSGPDGGDGGTGGPAGAAGTVAATDDYPCGNPQTGSNGSVGAGGGGGDGSQSGSGGAGGGGGGYYGGGGGPTEEQFSGGAGGGGSSFGPAGTTFQTALHSATPEVVISWTAPPPSVSIVTPTDGALYALNEVVDSDFSCNEGALGPGLTSCVDENGNTSGTALDTSSVGTYTLTVTANSGDGLMTVKSVSYTVASPPTVHVATPVNGEIYSQGAAVDSSFTCTEGIDGPGVASCLDQNGDPSGTALDTSTPGLHTLTVTAISLDDEQSSISPTYTVAAPPTVEVAGPIPGAVYRVDAHVVTSFSCTEGASGPGLISCLDENGDPSGTAVDIGKPGRYSLTVAAVSKDGQQARKTVSYRVAAAPHATIAFPKSGRKFTLRERVRTIFSCHDGAGGPGIARCTDSNGKTSHRGFLHTHRVGAHVYSVTARSKDGQTKTTRVRYRVVRPAPRCHDPDRDHDCD